MAILGIQRNDLISRRNGDDPFLFSVGPVGNPAAVAAGSAFDASALVKRYLVERGSRETNEFTAKSEMTATSIASCSSAPSTGAM